MNAGDRRRFRYLRLVPPGAALACGLVLGGLVALVGGAAGGSGMGDRPWLAAALWTGLSLKCAIVSGVCAFGMAVVVAMFRPARTAGRHGAQDGVAMLEFALVLPIALMIVLVMAQSSLLLGGNVCVHHAAYCAARTAIVTIPARLGAELPNEPGPAKGHRIRRSAVWALLPVACGSRYYSPTVDAGMISGALDAFFASYGRPSPAWATNTEVLSRKLSYADDPAYTELSIVPPDDGMAYGRNEDITVNLRHTYYLTVPYAGSLFARVLDADNGRELGFGAGEYGLDIYASCTLTNQGVRNYIEPVTFE